MERSASGLAWETAGTTAPVMGRERFSAELSASLAGKSPAPSGKIEFSRDEWKQFGISDLQPQDYVRGRGAYFKPADGHIEYINHCDGDLVVHCEVKVVGVAGGARRGESDKTPSEGAAARCAHPDEAYADERYTSFDSICPSCGLQVPPARAARDTCIPAPTDLGAVLCDPPIVSECRLIRGDPSGCFPHLDQPAPETREAEWGRNAADIKFVRVGSARPSSGTELQNVSLGEALASKSVFSQPEWDAFDISSLRTDHFIESRSSYFVIVPPCHSAGCSVPHCRPSRTRRLGDASGYEKTQLPNQHIANNNTPGGITRQPSPAWLMLPDPKAQHNGAEQQRLQPTSSSTVADVTVVAAKPPAIPGTPALLPV